jgi:hypothetical protein
VAIEVQCRGDSRVAHCLSDDFRVKTWFVRAR